MNFEQVPISILTPTYNRSRFLPLYIDNLLKINYPHNLLEVVIDDDGKDKFIKDIELFKKTISPIKVKYINKSLKRSIGEKRNFLVKQATSKIVCFMDDDDIYNPEYVNYSFQVLKKNKAGLVGSNQMIFCYPEKDFKMTYIICEMKHQIHEATMMFTKSYWKSMGGFERSSRGEGAKMIQKQDRNVSVTDIRMCMICVAHKFNTVDKNMFDKEDNTLKEKYNGDKTEILKSILL